MIDLSKIESAELAMPDPELSLGPAENAEAVTDMDGAVNTGSVVGFASGLDAQDKRDVLDTMQFASRAASANADRVSEPKEWYSSYTGWLETLGWVMPNFAFEEFEFEDVEALMDAAVLKIVGAIATTSGLTLLTSLLDTLRMLSDESRQIKLFDLRSEVKSGGNFQVGIVDIDQAGGMSMALGGFYYLSEDRRRKILFAKWGRQRITLWANGAKCSFNREHFEPARERIREKLGEERDRLIAGVSF